MINQINVLGSKYKIKYIKSHKEMCNIENSAECDYSEKLIRVANSEDGIDMYSDKWKEESLLHEIAHAFMYETGQSDLNDERHAELLCKFASYVKRIL